MAILCLFLIFKIYWGGFHADITLEDGTVMKQVEVVKSSKIPGRLETSDGKICFLTKK